MEKYFAAWLIAWTLVTVGIIVSMKKKNRKHDLTKFTIIAGITLAAILGVICFFAIRIQMANMLH